MSDRRNSKRLASLEAAKQVVVPVADAIWAATRGVEGGRTIVFLGAESGVGTTLISLAAALTLVEYVGLPVHLIEADFEEPRLASYLDLHQKHGLSEYLAGTVELRQCRARVKDCPGLTVVPGGGQREPSATDFSSPRLQALLNDARRQGAFVFVDSPPLLRIPQTRGLLALADDVVLVVRARKTRWAVARRTAELIRNLDVNLLGTVLNCYKPDLPFGLRRLAADPSNPTESAN